MKNRAYKNLNQMKEKSVNDIFWYFIFRNPAMKRTHRSQNDVLSMCFNYINMNQSTQKSS